MSVAKVIEVVGASEESFDDAVRQAVLEAQKTIRGITGVHVTNLTAKVRDDRIVEYRVDCKIAFGIRDEGRHVRPEMQEHAERGEALAEAPAHGGRQAIGLLEKRS